MLYVELLSTYPNYFCFLRFIFQVVRQGKEVSSLYLITSPSRDALAAATLSLNLFTVPLVRAAYVTLTWFASERTLTQSPVARLDEKQIQFSFEKTCVFRDLRNCIHQTSFHTIFRDLISFSSGEFVERTIARLSSWVLNCFANVF